MKTPPEAFDTMKQAASFMGLELKTLRKAKDAGCPAFRGSRIYREELEGWLKEHKAEITTAASKESVQIEKLLQEVRKLTLQNDEKEKKLIAVTEFQRQISEMASEVQKRMYAIPSRAPELAGLSVPDIETKLTAWIDGVVEALGKE